MLVRNLTVGGHSRKAVDGQLVSAAQTAGRPQNGDKGRMDKRQCPSAQLEMALDTAV